VLVAAGWGFVGGIALLVGALVGVRFTTSQRTVGVVMAFGAGVLISALAFELTQESYRRGGAIPVTLGLAAGGLLFSLGDWIIDRRGGDGRKRSGGQQSDGSASAIVLGALMDGIPESVAIGISLLGGEGVGVATVAAVFLSNVPESLSAATGLQKAGHSTGWILRLWLGVAVLSGIAAGVGYALLGDAPAELLGFIQAFAAGAIIAMLADTMMPESFQDAGRAVGLVTLLGFALAFLLSTID
jgi:ZIP family zinc transporter